MREIKFRVFYDGEMDYDNFDAPMMEFNEGICQMQEEGYVFMQYTGLKDNNGKEIYEGDILIRDMGVSVVVWGVSQTRCGWAMPLIKEDWAYGFNAVALSCDGKKLEVIGNIYQNKELLNEDN